MVECQDEAHVGLLVATCFLLSVLVHEDQII